MNAAAAAAGSPPAAAGPPEAAAGVLPVLRSTWAAGTTRPLAWRLQQLRALESMLGEQAAAIEEALSSDLGRNPTETYLAEVYSSLREVRALRRGLPRWSRHAAVRVPLVVQPARSWLRWEPLGVVLVVAPWNYPVNLSIVPLAAALAAGNCAVLKPSEHAPAASALLADILPRYLDRDALAVVEGGPEATGELIDAGVDHVFFTGGTAVGRLVAERAARRLTPVTLELGGKSPVIVDRGVDVRRAANRIAWGKLINAGQTCVAPDYVLVHEGVEEALLEALQRAVVKLYGEDPASSRDFARIVNDAHLDRLGGLLVGHGGRVVLGGQLDPARRYVAPTLISRPDPGSPLMGEEIFGPLLPVLPVADLAAAARAVGERPDPLAMYVFSNDDAGVARLLDATRSGSVALNTVAHQFAVSRLPFGGVGSSGSGRYHGRYGFETLSHLRPVLRKPLRPDPPFAYPPYRPLWSQVLRRLLR